MRVLRIIGRANVGGPALQLAVLANGLDPRRYEQRVLVGSVGPHESDYLELRAPDVDHVHIGGLGREIRPSDDLRALRAIASEVRRFRPHIVHTHAAKAGALGRTVALASRTPATVHTYHGHLLHGYFSPVKTRAVIAVERLLAARTTRLASVGERVRDDLLEAGVGKAEQYVVIPPGVPEPETVEQAEARRRLALPQDASVVAFVARLTRVKRPDRFAEMASCIAAQVPDAHFVVAGGGELLDDLRRACAPLGSRVHFLGWRADIGTVYGAADVVTLTSDNEGMPVTLIEAAMCNRPAVTTEVGSAREVVSDGETGIVTRTHDGAELAAAVVRLLDKPELRETMGRAAGARARERFGANRLVSDTAKLYDEIAEEKGFG